MVTGTEVGSETNPSTSLGDYEALITMRNAPAPVRKTSLPSRPSSTRTTRSEASSTSSRTDAVKVADVAGEAELDCDGEHG